MYEHYCKIRDLRGLKDSDVSRATGITKSTFSDWKSGRSNPKNDKLQKISDYLNVSIDYLMTGEHNNGYYLDIQCAQKAQEMYEDQDMRFLFELKHNISPERFQIIMDFIQKLYAHDKTLF